MMLSNSSGRRLCLSLARYVARNRLWLVCQHHPVNIIVLLMDSLGRCPRVYVAHNAVSSCGIFMMLSTSSRCCQHHHYHAAGTIMMLRHGSWPCCAIWGLCLCNFAMGSNSFFCCWMRQGVCGQAARWSPCKRRGPTCQASLARSQHPPWQSSQAFQLSQTGTFNGRFFTTVPTCPGLILPSKPLRPVVPPPPTPAHPHPSGSSPIRPSL